MWRETNLAGVLISPLVTYLVAALIVWLPVRFAFEHLGLDRWTYNTPLMEAALYVGILGALVVLL